MGDDGVYLGDGVYVYSESDWGFWVVTSNGIVETNRVFLEPDVAVRLLGWIAHEKPDLIERAGNE